MEPELVYRKFTLAMMEIHEGNVRELRESLYGENRSEEGKQLAALWESCSEVQRDALLILARRASEGALWRFMRYLEETAEEVGEIALVARQGPEDDHRDLTLISNEVDAGLMLSFWSWVRFDDDDK